MPDRAAIFGMGGHEVRRPCPTSSAEGRDDHRPGPRDLWGSSPTCSSIAARYRVSYKPQTPIRCTGVTLVGARCAEANDDVPGWGVGVVGPHHEKSDQVRAGRSKTSQVGARRGLEVLPRLRRDVPGCAHLNGRGRGHGSEDKRDGGGDGTSAVETTCLLLAGDLGTVRRSNHKTLGGSAVPATAPVWYTV